MKKLLTVLLLSLYYLSAIVILPIGIILWTVDKVMGYISYGSNRLSAAYLTFIEKYHDACYDTIH